MSSIQPSSAGGIWLAKSRQIPLVPAITPIFAQVPRALASACWSPALGTAQSATNSRAQPCTFHGRLRSSASGIQHTGPTGSGVGTSELFRRSCAIPACPHPNGAARRHDKPCCSCADSRPKNRSIDSAHARCHAPARPGAIGDGPHRQQLEKGLPARHHRSSAHGP